MMMSSSLFLVEIELAFREQRCALGAAKASDRGLDVRRPSDAHLAAPVVPARRHLDPERRAEVRGGDCERLRRRDGTPRGNRNAGPLHEPPLRQAVLRHAQWLEPRADRYPLDGGADDVEREVLKLVRDDVGVLRQVQRRLDVVVGTDNDPIRDRGGGTVGIGVEDHDPVAHRAGRKPEHPPELAAAEDADRGRGEDRLRMVSVVTTPDDSVSR